MSVKKIASILAFALAAGTASAADFSFTGNFTYDNDVQVFSFEVGAQSDVSLRSWSYAGGVNAKGQTIARGGFDPILALFDANGVMIDEQDDAECPDVDADTATGQCWDTFYTRSLAAGKYTVTIMQFDNFSSGTLAGGFDFDGVQHRYFRNGFEDDTDDKRNNKWAFDILNVKAATVPNPVPEPGSVLLLGLALAYLVGAARRKRA